LHRIRYYGLFANAGRKDNLARAHELLMNNTTNKSSDAETNDADTADSGKSATYVCPDCGTPMIIIETFNRGHLPRAPPKRIAVS